jgi:hypothetical protein
MARRTLTPSRASVRLRAAQLGALVHFHVDREGLEHEITIDAPDGYIWTASAVHQLVQCGADGTPMDALAADALERMAYGLERCDDPDCDICHPDEPEATS